MYVCLDVDPSVLTMGLCYPTWPTCPNHKTWVQLCIHNNTPRCWRTIFACVRSLRLSRLVAIMKVVFLLILTLAHLISLSPPVDKSIYLSYQNSTSLFLRLHPARASRGKRKFFSLVWRDLTLGIDVGRCCASQSLGKCWRERCEGMGKVNLGLFWNCC